LERLRDLLVRQFGPSEEEQHLALFGPKGRKSKCYLFARPRRVGPILRVLDLVRRYGSRPRSCVRQKPTSLPPPVPAKEVGSDAEQPRSGVWSSGVVSSPLLKR